MKTFKVPFSVVCTVYVIQEAETREDAIDLASKEVYLSEYVGNGGNDKLMGVYGDNISIEAGEDFQVIEGLIQELTLKSE